MVDSQIRGYLRWYGDLTDMSGYWPLAECIAAGTRIETFDPDIFHAVVEPFARERSCEIAKIRADIAQTIRTAVELHPDFASLVLGGLHVFLDIPRFVHASACWLKRFQLCLHPLVQGQQEALWKFRCSYDWQKKQEIPFISQADYELVRLRESGAPFSSLTGRLGGSTEELEKRYTETIERARLILEMGHSLPQSVPSGDVSACLQSLGFYPYQYGVAELDTAIRLVRDEPALLSSLSKKLYPAVSERVGRSPNAVGQRIREVISIGVLNSQRTGIYADFYRTAQLFSGSFFVSKFLRAFLSYMDSAEREDNHGPLGKNAVP